jgi:hypothetical protein
MINFNEDFDAELDAELDEINRRLLHSILDYADHTLTNNHPIYKAFNTGIFNNLIEYFEELEEYENCSILMKIQKVLKLNQYNTDEFLFIK